ncbi:hypothetical protein FHX74_001167 [Friedmanniella endophytica]|uniref:Uncharacterized protein n=1 Tax=Microlunatus kandeliicorticis TaxID=1759536 RepID=A0A7W3IQW1_9ACTN|nr:hypothetical protein [Microlunatus kandeliicorticis]MBA8793562.1 hypothetical protein [Microlunatus kandeliicorticis]
MTSDAADSAGDTGHTGDARTVAADLLARARRREQAVLPVRDGLDVEAVRAEVRRLARVQGVRVRTGLVEPGVLAVILADAALWGESTAVMRAKLSPDPADS